MVAAERGERTMARYTVTAQGGITWALYREDEDGGREFVRHIQVGRTAEGTQLLGDDELDRLLPEEDQDYGERDIWDVLVDAGIIEDDALLEERG